MSVEEAMEMAKRKRSVLDNNPGWVARMSIPSDEAIMVLAQEIERLRTRLELKEYAETESIP